MERIDFSWLKDESLAKRYDYLINGYIDYCNKEMSSIENKTVRKSTPMKLIRCNLYPKKSNFDLKTLNAHLIK